MADPRKFNEEEITTCLFALVAWAGNATAASRYLKAEKEIDITPVTLSGWKVSKQERLEGIREKYAGQLEGKLANEMRDVVALALEGQRLAIEKATDRLNSGKDEDPGRTAANLARVAQSSTDKMLSLTGRPTQITETRNLAEIMRGLVAKGIFTVSEAPQIEAKDG